MFSPSRTEARRFLFDTWRKYRAQVALEGLEQTALEVIFMHPEYHALLDHPERNFDRDYAPENGQLNPFLHLSLHLAIAEQLSIDQPQGIRALCEKLVARAARQHDALHALLECLGKTVWEAQRTGATPDEEGYIDCVRRSLG